MLRYICLCSMRDPILRYALFMKVQLEPADPPVNPSHRMPEEMLTFVPRLGG